MNRWERRNPRAAKALEEEVLALSRTVAREEASRGAVAVLLAGSWARGDARRGSDVDLWVMGPRSGHTFFEREGHVLSISRRTVREELKALRAPPYGGQAQAAWGYALPLWDPKGVARRLAREAARWRKRELGPAWDRYVARELTEWGEEVVKIVRAMAEGARETAAVERNVLANHMAMLVGCHLRLRHHEFGLWELAGTRMGRDWHRLQLRALAVGGEGLEASCEAAVDLYFATARAVERSFTPNQRKVVDLVARAAGRRAWRSGGTLSRRARRRPGGRRGRGASGGSSSASRRARPG